MSRFAAAYRQTLNGLPEADQTKIARFFVDLVRHDSTERIQIIGDAFFLATDLAFLSESDRKLILSNFVNRLDTSDGPLANSFVESLGGIGKYIKMELAKKFAGGLIKAALRESNSQYSKTLVLAQLEFERVEDAAVKDVISEYIGVWLKISEERNYSNEKKRVLQALNLCWDDIPF